MLRGWRRPGWARTAAIPIPRAIAAGIFGDFRRKAEYAATAGGKEEAGAALAARWRPTAGNNGTRSALTGMNNFGNVRSSR